MANIQSRVTDSDEKCAANTVRLTEWNSRRDEVSIDGGEGVVHHQPVPTLRQQPLHVELQLGAGGSLEVPHAGGALRVGATESHRAAGIHFLVAVAVLKKGWRK